MAKKTTNPHRLQVIRNPSPAYVGQLKSGDLFERNGAPCLVVSLSQDFFLPAEAGKVPIVNLTTGAVWYVHETTEVVQMYDITLDYILGS